MQSFLFFFPSNWESFNWFELGTWKVLKVVEKIIAIFMDFPIKVFQTGKLLHKFLVYNFMSFLLSEM
jgi:hypothetical protein